MYYGGVEDRELPMANHVNETLMTGVIEEGHTRDFRGCHVDGPTNQVNEDDNIIAAQTYINTGPNLDATSTTSTDFTLQPSQSGISAVTDLTKTVNWIQRIVEELKDLIHILTPDGRILYISEAIKQLTGYSQEELTGKFITDFLHPDDITTFVREFEDAVANGEPMQVFYRFCKQTGEYAVFESHGHPHLNNEAASFGQNDPAALCNGFFMMARLYPAKNAALLDSFLEQKIENERLMKKIETLRREEADEQGEYQHQWKKEHEGYWDQHPSDENKTALSAAMGHSTTAELITMPPPVKPLAINSTSSRHGLEDANATNKPDSIEENISRHGGRTHIETIEMLTGLRYQDGERSQGISTGDASPTLIRGDVSIVVLGPKDERGGDKKKKPKVADEYACYDCGTLDSPEWRKGPTGPKTLCNACGLRWSKKEKKERKQTGFNITNSGGALH